MLSILLAWNLDSFIIYIKRTIYRIVFIYVDDWSCMFVCYETV